MASPRRSALARVVEAADKACDVYSTERFDRLNPSPIRDAVLGVLKR